MSRQNLKLICETKDHEQHDIDYGAGSDVIHCIMGLLLLKIAIKMAAELQNIARDKKTIELGWPPIAQYCARGENIEESTIQAKK